MADKASAYNDQSPSHFSEAHKAAAAAAAHPSSGFRIGFSEDCNKRRRRTMEDAHSYFYDFGGVVGQGFFAIFDGHASKSAAEWCGNHLHEVNLASGEQNEAYAAGWWAREIRVVTLGARNWTARGESERPPIDNHQRLVGRRPSWEGAHAHRS